MTKNIALLPKTKLDIDKRVDRVLRGLGNPEPPLRLEDVRELLKLDLKFYTADDPSLAREAISRIRVGTIQVFKRPALIAEAIRTFSLKALYLPDRRRILLDGSIPKLKHRWNEAHEVGHSLLPWHEEMMHGDNDQTLSKGCMEHIEAEANFAAGRMLFLQNRFDEEVLSSALSIASITRLRDRFGNTLSSTLWRFVESIGGIAPVVGMITCHPHAMRRPADFNPLAPCKHFIQSSAFHRQFSKLTEIELFNSVAGYCGPQRGGLLGEGELILSDDNGLRHRFHFETFFNRYDALTLGVYQGPASLSIVLG
jgi:hypothetical protein